MIYVWFIDLQIEGTFYLSNFWTQIESMNNKIEESTDFQDRINLKKESLINMYTNQLNN